MKLVLRMTLAPWLAYRYRARAENREAIRSIRPPYLLLANHGSVWDPFLVALYLPRVPNYVVSDANFRSPLIEFGLGLVGGIAKTKVMSDLDTIKNIMKVKDAGGIVGIFPEGQSNWDGHSLPLYYSTAKLAKLLKIPVVTARLAGAFLSRPRWSKYRRPGRVVIRFDVAFMPSELRTASVEQIDARIAKMLNHDEFTYNRRRRIKFLGPARAEYAEIALFMCPQCHEIGTLHSDRNKLACRSCGYTVRLDIYGFFKPVSGAIRFDTMHAWNLWQVEELRRLLREALEAPLKERIFSEEVTIEIGYRSMPLEPYASGRLELYTDRIVLIPSEGEASIFPIDRIVGINVQNNERLEFYYEDSLYRISAIDRRACTYKWDVAVRYLQELATSSAAV